MTTTTLHDAQPIRHRRRVTPGLSVNGLRRHLLYKPLAILMALLVLTMFLLAPSPGRHKHSQ